MSHELANPASYERENIVLWEPPVCWGVRWQRPECGCFLMCGLIPDENKPFDKSDLLWAMKGCPEHEKQIEVVLRTMKEMPPCDEEVGALFTRLLEAEIRGGEMADQNKLDWLRAEEPQTYADERLTSSGPVALTIHTKVPSKWRFVDLETGDVWKAKPSGGFTRAGTI